jgi:hypothetical protein
MNKINIDDIVDYTGLKDQISQAIRYNDKKIIEQLMLPENYPNLSQQKKEEEIFNMALDFLFFGLETEAFLKFFIFEYGVSEDVHSKINSKYKNSLVEDMFATRKLNEELEKELEKSNHKVIQRPKV